MTTPTPEENINLQKKWCDSASKAIQDGATSAVKETAKTLNDAGIEIGTVLEIGPQYGFGLKEWTKLADKAYGLEIVPEFQNQCLSLGLPCSLGCAEELNENDHLPGPYNYYLRDVVEHFVDRDVAWANILEKLDTWIFIAVPIEPDEPRDKAHFGKFSSVKEVQELFEGMTPVSETIREPAGKIIGRYKAIFKKTN
jgi:hypothetical protein